MFAMFDYVRHARPQVGSIAMFAIPPGVGARPAGESAIATILPAFLFEIRKQAPDVVAAAETFLVQRIKARLKQLTCWAREDAPHVSVCLLRISACRVLAHASRQGAR